MREFNNKVEVYMLEPVAVKIAPLLIGAGERLGVLAGTAVTVWTQSVNEAEPTSNNNVNTSRETLDAPQRTAQETAQVVNVIEQRVLQEAYDEEDVEERSNVDIWPGPVDHTSPEEIERRQEHEWLREAFEEAKEVMSQEKTLAKKAARIHEKKSKKPRKIQLRSEQTELQKEIKGLAAGQLGLSKKDPMKPLKKTRSKIHKVDRRAVSLSKSKAHHAVKVDEHAQEVERARANFQSIKEKVKVLEDALIEAQFVFRLVYEKPVNTHTANKAEHISGKEPVLVSYEGLPEGPEKEVMVAQQKHHDAMIELNAAQATLEEVLNVKEDKDKEEDSNHFYNQYGEMGVEAFCYVIGILFKDYIKSQALDDKKTAASISAELDKFVAPFQEFEKYAIERKEALTKNLGKVNTEIKTLEIAKAKYSKLHAKQAKELALYSKSKKEKLKSVFGAKFYKTQEKVKDLEDLIDLTKKSIADLKLKKEEIEKSTTEIDNLLQVGRGVIKDIQSHKEKRSSEKAQIDTLKPILDFAMGFLNARARVLKQPSSTSFWKPSKADVFQVGLDFIVQERGSDLNKKDLEKARKIFNKYWESDVEPVAEETLGRQLKVGGLLATSQGLQSIAWHAYTTQTNPLFQRLSLLRKSEIVEKFAEKIAPASLSESNKNLLRANIIGSSLGGAVMIKEIFAVGSAQVPQNAIKAATEILNQQIGNEIQAMRKKIGSLTDVSEQASVTEAPLPKSDLKRRSVSSERENVERTQLVRQRSHAEQAHASADRPIRAVQGFRTALVGRIDSAVHDTQSSQQLVEYKELLRQHEILIQKLDFILIPIEGVELSSADAHMQKELFDLKTIIENQYNLLISREIIELIAANDEETKNNIMNCINRLKQISNLIENISMNAQIQGISPLLLEKLKYITE